ncbi:DnaA N-terminal domain-containing protein [Avibacterium endocarditidis]|uniref:DnaA N-terminal domain-containing protein n=1 Tax=Avibacterium endocarditidis TaxID=380674 RepID=UPI003CCB9433
MKTTLASLWQDCLSQLQDQVSPTDFSTWLRPLQADIVGENNMVLYASNVLLKTGWKLIILN